MPTPSTSTRLIRPPSRPALAPACEPQASHGTAPGHGRPARPCRLRVGGGGRRPRGARPGHGGGIPVDREQVRAAFEDPKEFTTSPLYRCLSRTVAATGQLLDLAGQGRPGQYPTFLFFGAVHLLLLAGTDHPLARFYPSIAGQRTLPPGPGCRRWCGR